MVRPSKRLVVGPASGMSCVIVTAYGGTTDANENAPASVLVVPASSTATVPEIGRSKPNENALPLIAIGAIGAASGASTAASVVAPLSRSLPGPVSTAVPSGVVASGSVALDGSGSLPPQFIVTAA